MVRLAVLVTLAAPAVARAADVSVTDGVLRYTATPGKVSNVTFTETAPRTVQLTTGADDTDGLKGLAGCSGTPVVCTGVTSATIDAGDMSDRITATYGDPPANGLLSIPAVINGGDGNDALAGGAGRHRRGRHPGHDLAHLRDRLHGGHPRRGVRRPPPAPAWTLPEDNASLRPDAASRLSVSASDDRGIAEVGFYDDDRRLCEVTAPPFDCAYTPRGSDLGRNTLIAVAVDGANQTTSIVRVVTVRRFSAPSLSLSLAPSRDRTAPYAFHVKGKLTRPTPVSPSQGCSGTVTVSAKKASKTVSAHRASLDRNCEYQLTLKFRSRLASRLRLSARFTGNDVISERSARSRTVRLG